MDKFPLVWRERAVGELSAEREALYTWFDARCRLPGEGLWCAWVVGENGELRLGVLEPAGDRAAIRRRFSDRMTAPLGRLLRGEVRSAAPAAERGDWQSAEEPETLFRAPLLRQRLRGVQGALTRTGQGRRFLALPYDREKPFLLTALFCFARVRRIQGREYAVFAFDEEENPLQIGDAGR